MIICQSSKKYVNQYTQLLLIKITFVRLRRSRKCNISIKDANRFPFNLIRCKDESFLAADFHSVEFSEKAEILLFAGENVALKLNK